MTEEQFEWLTSDHGKRKAMFTKEELRRKIKENPEEWKCDGEATCQRFMTDLGIGLGPYALDGTASYLHDDKLHPNNPVVLSEAGK